MERITINDGKGNYEAQIGIYTRDLLKVIGKYEDSGLTPDEVMILKNHFNLCEKDKTNFEHYKDAILKSGGEFGIFDGKIIPCSEAAACEGCYFDIHSDIYTCDFLKIKWLCELYELMHFTKDKAFCEMIDRGFIFRSADNCLYWCKNEDKSNMTGIDDFGVMFPMIDDGRMWSIGELTELPICEEYDRSCENDERL